MNRRTIFIAVVFALGMAGLSAPASAQGWGNSFSAGEARNASENGSIKPLRDVIQSLKRQFGGSYLNAELFSREGGGADYHIDWITDDGRKLRLIVDAESGRVTSSTGG